MLISGLAVGEPGAGPDEAGDDPVHPAERTIVRRRRDTIAEVTGTGRSRILILTL